MLTRQVFTPTASFLYDCSGLLEHWLHDLRLEQEANDGVPPLVIPNTLKFSKRFAIWGDVSALTPKNLFEAFGDVRVLRDQWESMVNWLERGVVQENTGLWDRENQQLGD
jgi:alpha-L-rhamnosidase